MHTVKIKSYAKINLTLEIVGEENGYHLLDSCVASVDIFDVIVLKKRKDKHSSVLMHGMGSEEIPPEKNNAWKAAEAFSEKFSTNGADIVIYKNIPIGAGLGGSSADISGVINGMAKLYGVKNKAAMKDLADMLGSDTGYMLTGGFARMQGRGEIVTPLATDAKLHLLMLCPSSSVSAGSCYREYDRLAHENALQSIKKEENFTQNCILVLEQNDVNGVGRCLMNDLFTPSACLNVDVQTAMDELKTFAPLGVTMSGSGSCVFALFETKELCEWAKSRYKGKFRAYVTQTIVPDYDGKTTLWRNPFALRAED